MSDKDFVENSFVFCRNFFSIDIVLTSDQFLSEKYFDKKVELLANLTKRIYEWD